MSLTGITTALPQHKSSDGPNDFHNVQHIKKTWASSTGNNPVLESVFAFDEGYPSVVITYTLASRSIRFSEGSLPAVIAFELMSKLYTEISNLRVV